MAKASNAMSDKRWKAVERKVAAKVRGQRIPVTGERDGADVLSPMFAYQVKSRRRHPRWLTEWVAGITGASAPKIGVVVLHTPGHEVDDALVVLRFKDWVDLHGSVR